MKKETGLSPSGLQYASAYEKHYGSEDLHTALLAYNAIMIEYPYTKEAEYSRSQIRNIARSVVPEKLLHEAQFNLALKHSGHDSAPDNRPVEEVATVQGLSDTMDHKPDLLTARNQK